MFKIKKRLFSLTLLLCLIFCISCKEAITEKGYHYELAKDSITGEVRCIDADYVVCLEKNPNKDFVILNLSDIQEDSPADCSDLQELIEELINTVEPDLITITGDISYGKESTIREFAEILEQYEIPWAPVFGNHDHNEEDTTIEEQCVLYESFEHCLFKTGLDFGTTNSGEVPRLGNYVINIVENNKRGFSVVKSLVFLDTGDSISGTNEDNTGKKHYVYGGNYDHLNSKQVEFFNDVLESANSYGRGKDVDAVLFIHIPLFEYVEAIGAALNTEIDVYRVIDFVNYAKTISYEDSYSSDKWKEGYETSFGVFHEPCCCTSYDDKVFDAIKDNTDAIIAGHDHVNNFVVDYEDVLFCYTTKTGKGCYYDSSINGGTVISISGEEKPGIRHQIWSQAQ